MLAHNLVRWAATLGAPAADDPSIVARTFRRRLIDMPGRLANHAGTPVLHAPLNWPWRDWFTRRLTALPALEPASG